jgi:hypothetical protein
VYERQIPHRFNRVGRLGGARFVLFLSEFG